MDSMQKIYKRERTGFRPIDVSSFHLYHPFYNIFLLGIASQGVINDHLNSTVYRNRSGCKGCTVCYSNVN